MITIPVEIPHISQPNAMPSASDMPYISSVSLMKMGNEPMPPGVTIIARADNVSTENAAFRLRWAVPSIA